METQKASTTANLLQKALHWELSLVRMMVDLMVVKMAGLMALKRDGY